MQRRNRLRVARSFLAIAALTLCACSVGPDFSRPAAPATDRYTREPLAATTVAAGGQAQHQKDQQQGHEDRRQDEQQAA